MSMTNAYIPGLRAAVGHGLPGRPQRSASSPSRISGEIYSRLEAADPQAVAAGTQLLFNRVYNRADYPGVEALFAKGNPKLALVSPEPFQLTSTASSYLSQRAVVSPDGSKFVIFGAGYVHVYATGTRTLIATGTAQRTMLWEGADSVFWVNNSTFYVGSRGNGEGSAYLDVFRVPQTGSNLVKTSAITASNNWIMNCQAVYEDGDSLVLGWSNNNYGAGKITITKSTGIAAVTSFAQGAANLKAIYAFKRNGRPVQGVETYLEVKGNNSNSTLIQVRNISTGSFTTIITPAADNLVLPSQQFFSFSSDGYVYAGEPLKNFVRFSPDGTYKILGIAPAYSASPLGGIIAVDDTRRVILSSGAGTFAYDADQIDFKLLVPVPSDVTAHRPIGLSPYTASENVIDYAIGVRGDRALDAVVYSGASKFLVDLPHDHRTGFRV